MTGISYVLHSRFVDLRLLDSARMQTVGVVWAFGVAGSTYELQGGNSLVNIGEWREG